MLNSTIYKTDPYLTVGKSRLPDPNHQRSGLFREFLSGLTFIKLITGILILFATTTTAQPCTNPIVDAVANQNFNVGDVSPSVVFTSNVPGAVFTWSRTNEAIGLASNSGTGNVPSFTAINSSCTTSIVATFSVVATSTSNGITCTGTPIQFTITVNPIPSPNVTAVANQTVNVGDIVPSIVFTSNVTGADYSWSRTNEAIGLAGNGGTGNIPSFAATNTSCATPIAATFSVVASYTSGGVTCYGTPIQFTITVNPIPSPNVSAVTNQTFDVGDVVPSVVFTSNVTGANYTWSRTNEAIGLAGNSGTGNIPSFTAANTSCSTQLSATFNVVASYTSGGITCYGTPIQFTISVNPTPTPNVAAITNQIFNAGDVVPSVVFTSNIQGAIYNWSRTNEAIGLAGNSGTGNVPSFTATNSSGSPIICTFSAVASYGNCTGAPIQFTITVNPVVICDITGVSLQNVGSCNDNGTNDPTDDYYTADVAVSFVNPPATGFLQIEPGGDQIGTNAVAVGSLVGGSHTFTGVQFKADGTITVVEVEFTVPANVCVQTITGPTVQPCSPVCDITGVTLQNIGSCSNNGTIDPVDDFYTADVTVSFVNPPATGFLQIEPGGDQIGTNAVAVGSLVGGSHTFSGVHFKADGTITVIEVEFTIPANLCVQTITGPTVQPCSYAPPVITCNPSIAVSCASEVPAVNTSNISETHDCPGTVTITHVGDVVSNQSCPNRYTITRTYQATDQCGNNSTCSQIITVNDQTTPAISNITSPAFNGYNIHCNGDCDGSATVTATDNCFGALTYLWSNGESKYTATGLCAGTHTVTVTDACGNSAVSTITLTQPPVLTIDAGLNKVVYKGYPDSSCTNLQSTVTGGVAPYTRNWSTSGNASVGAGTSINVCPSSTRIYYLTVTDANGCTKTDSVKVCVIDVRCGSGKKNVTICHGTGSASNPFVTLCVDKNGAKWHFLNHPGEQLGACGINKSCDFNPYRLSDSGIDEIADEMEYLSAFPNPFSNTTTIRFVLPENDFSIIKVFDFSGRAMLSLFEGATVAGTIYEVILDGSKFPDGMYFVLMNTQSGSSQARKLILER